MKRQVSLNEISDGRLYGSHDMARIGCRGCSGCSQCCHGMGESAILDPMDAERLSRGLGCPFSALLEHQIALNVVDGIILPNLDMSGAEEACQFLTEEGRCGIHPYRPGVCRLFPLGRYYENNSFRYFIQSGECPAPNKTKVKIEKWLDLPDMEQYEEAVLSWHMFLSQAEELIGRESDDKRVKDINLYILELFYLKAYDSEESVYPQLKERIEAAREVLDLG